MCGIFFSLSRTSLRRPSHEHLQDLQRRGPDSLDKYTVSFTVRDAELHLCFISTVLALRGSQVVTQPLVDPKTGSALCWNGEAWSIDSHDIVGNDSEAIFRLLIEACSAAPTGTSARNVAQAVSLIAGPFAFVFYDAVHRRMFYSRDSLGRRSLVQSQTSDGLILSSIAESSSLADWTEVECDGLRVLNLINERQTHDAGKTSSHLSLLDSSESNGQIHLLSPFEPLNTSVPQAATIASLRPEAPSVHELNEQLYDSLNLRVRNIRPIEVMQHEAHLAVLFSGGLDCSVLARLMHDILDPQLTIDLINVAFQNPRIHKAPQQGEDIATVSYELCPDRITGVSALAELQRICPNRHWRFVRVDVPYDEYLEHKTTVLALIHPHNTEMDLSIASALYFAARGQGTVAESTSGIVQPYISKARVLISGLGADELFGGYQRHATAYSRLGFPGLIDELQLDVSRLGKRNLGRDDRVMCSWGKEVRFPYLDENLVRWALAKPVWEKCGFGGLTPEGSTQTSLLPPDKLVLRLVASKLGMAAVSIEKKRAIQFGARTAKMENSKVKGTHVAT